MSTVSILDQVRNSAHMQGYFDYEPTEEQRIQVKDSEAYDEGYRSATAHYPSRMRWFMIGALVSVGAVLLLS